MPVKLQASVKSRQKVHRLGTIEDPFDLAVREACRQLPSEIPDNQLAAKCPAPIAFKFTEGLDGELTLVKGSQDYLRRQLSRQQTVVDASTG